MIHVSETGRSIALLNARHELYTNLYREFDKRIVDAMTRVPREEFVDPAYYASSFKDSAQPITGYESSSISQPSTVARMTQLLDPQEEDIVCEIGTATGYQSAVLAQLSKQVFTVESIPELAYSAEQRLQRLNYRNVRVIADDGSRRFSPPEFVDKLLITASVFPSIQVGIYEILKPGSVCVCPIGGVNGENTKCDLVKMIKTDNGMTIDTVLPGYRFIPIEGAYGWSSYIQGFINHANADFYESLGYQKKVSASTEE